MKRAGKTNRHLIQGVIEASLPIEIPCPILFQGQEAGTLTSMAAGPTTEERLRCVLGFRKRKFEQSDSFRIAQPDGTPTDYRVTGVRRLPRAES